MKPANGLEQVQEMLKKLKANNQNDIPEKDLLNSSTLSLHIAAYENSVEAYAQTNELNEEKKGSKTDNGKLWKNAKQIIAGLVSVVQNPFEFPRQQKNQTGEPEVMQFKASQRLLNPNELKTERSNYVSTYTKPANRLEQVQEMFERRKANDQNDIPEKDLLKNSTLSLHIAAYENSAEASAHTNECNEVKEGSNNGKSWFYKKAKQVIAGPVSTVQNPLEFPRQQKNQTGEPDVMQFKASQRLRNPNDSAGTVGDQICCC
uniref:Uncharacterized protein n=1 Tax=Panagrolaimus sp. ES5 TaxID=591445 RepID=A0AC34GY17_9BILA